LAAASGSSLAVVDLDLREVVGEIAPAVPGVGDEDGRVIAAAAAYEATFRLISAGIMPGQWLPPAQS
jgi:hypothetical protein